MDAAPKPPRLSTEEKLSALKHLADERKAEPDTGLYDNLRGVHDDKPFVSPVTKSANNVDANIFIMLQDWTSTEDMSSPFNEEEYRLGYAPTAKTFEVLIRRLEVHFPNTTLADTYATNLFPFIKKGRPGAAIASKSLLSSTNKYALRQIQIVQPKLVIALGINAFWALSKVLDPKRPVGRLSDAIGLPLRSEDYEYQIWCQAHTASRRANDRVNAEWADMVKRSGVQTAK